MSFFSKIKSYFTGDASEKVGTPPASNSFSAGKGPGAHEQATVRRPVSQPVLQNAGYSQSGGVQGLNWYTARLKQDKDGDYADEFLEESSVHQQGKGPVCKSRDCLPLKAQQPGLAAQLGHEVVIIDQGNVHVIPSER